MSEEKGKSTLTIVLIVAGVVVVALVAVVGIMAALGISSFRRYVGAAKQAEGRAEVTRLAMGIARCAEDKQAKGEDPLPATAPGVPATLTEVSGKKYMSAPADWSHDAYACASFSVSMPQYFRYQWEKQSATTGVARAESDLDGDGVADATFEVTVSCSGGTCTKGAVSER